MLETYRGIVRPHHHDHMDHMNVQWYTGKFDEATWHLLSTVGLTFAYFKAEQRGMVALDQRTQYKEEVMAGNLLVCRSEILDVKEKIVRFKHHMYNAESDALVATTELVGAHLDRQERKTCPLPEAIRRRCEQLITPVI